MMGTPPSDLLGYFVFVLAKFLRGNFATARVAVPIIQLFANNIGTYQEIVP